MRNWYGSLQCMGGGMLIRAISVRSGFSAVRRDPRQSSFAPSCARRALLVASCALYLSWGVWFAAVLLASIVMNYLLGAMAAAKALRRLRLSIGIVLNLLCSSTFKYLPEAADHSPFLLLAALRAPRIAFGNLVLDLPGDELPVRPLSRRRTRSIVRRVCSLHGFLSRSRFPDRSAACPRCFRNSALRASRRSGMTSSTRLPAHRHRRADDATGAVAGTGNSRRRRHSLGFDRMTNGAAPTSGVWRSASACSFFSISPDIRTSPSARHRLLGFTVPENFARPFQSTTPSIFWTRWHMSLSFWIRDYVFFPLMRMRREVVVAKFRCSLPWSCSECGTKQASCFSLWGCYHGVLLILHRQVHGLERKFDWTPSRAPWTVLSWVITISLVSLGWIFFRANSLHQAGQMLTAVLSPNKLSRPFSVGKPLSAGSDAGSWLRDCAARDRQAQWRFARSARRRSTTCKLAHRHHRTTGTVTLVLAPAALRLGLAVRLNRHTKPGSQAPHK